MGKEDYFISGFHDATIGDDGSVLDDIVYSKDLFCEEIHFKRSWMPLTHIARKSILVNISDAIAMNARPLYALLGLVIPKDFSYKELDELQKAFRDICSEYGVRIIGGDTTAGKSLMISVTIVSQTKDPLFRSSMKKGDLIAYTGNLGESKKGLMRLLRGGKLATCKRFISPNLRSEFLYEARKWLHAGLDISDGLSKDLSRMCKQSGYFDVKFFAPISRAKLCSGEEYEMLFAFAPKNLARIQAIAKKHRVPLNLVGRACRGKYSDRCKENHF